MTNSTTYNNDWLATQTISGFVQLELKTYVFVQREVHSDNESLQILDVERKALYNSNYKVVPDQIDFAIDMSVGDALGRRCS